MRSMMMTMTVILTKHARRALTADLPCVLNECKLDQGDECVVVLTAVVQHDHAVKVLLE